MMVIYTNDGFIAPKSTEAELSQSFRLGRCLRELGTELKVLALSQHNQLKLKDLLLDSKQQSFGHFFAYASPLPLRHGS